MPLEGGSANFLLILYWLTAAGSNLFGLSAFERSAYPNIIPQGSDCHDSFSQSFLTIPLFIKHKQYQWQENKLGSRGC